ncbi:MAG: exodeoxyribonuclease VII large subunit, partial [Nitratireductor sp.]
ADRRAPTPTGAAEMAVPVKAELEATLASLAARLAGAISRTGERKRQALRASARALPSADQLLALPRRRFDEAAARLARGLQVNVDSKRLRLRGLRLTTVALERRLGEARRAVAQTTTRMSGAQGALVRDRRTRLATAFARLGFDPLLRRVRTAREHLSGLARRRDRAIAQTIEQRRNGLANTERLLLSMSYKSVLDRGFALVSDANGNPVKRAAGLATGDQVALRFADATADAVIVGSEPATPRKPRPPREKTVPGGQGSLFE